MACFIVYLVIINWYGLSVLLEEHFHMGKKDAQEPVCVPLLLLAAVSQNRDNEPWSLCVNKNAPRTRMHLV